MTLTEVSGVGGPAALMSQTTGYNRRPSLVIERRDAGTPHCFCGCFKDWSDKYHDWLCPHCDTDSSEQGDVQQ